MLIFCPARDKLAIFRPDKEKFTIFCLLKEKFVFCGTTNPDMEKFTMFLLINIYNILNQTSANFAELDATFLAISLRSSSSVIISWPRVISPGMIFESSRASERLT
jgi:hypothetical protein